MVKSYTQEKWKSERCSSDSKGQELTSLRQRPMLPEKKKKTSKKVICMSVSKSHAQSFPHKCKLLMWKHSQPFCYRGRDVI